MQCCGVKEISGISFDIPQNNLKKIYNHKFKTSSFFIFTSRDEKEFEYGRNFKKYILEHGLGDVIESNAKRNLNYPNDPSHDLRVYIWEPNHVAFTQWYLMTTKNEPAKPVEDEEYPDDNDDLCGDPECDECYSQPQTPDSDAD